MKWREEELKEKVAEICRAGGIQPAVEPVTLSESGSSLMVSANGGLGIPASVKTMERLLEKAAGGGRAARRHHVARGVGEGVGARHGDGASDMT